MISEQENEQEIEVGGVPRFPLELLEQSNESKKEYFKNYTVAHPLLMEAFNQIVDNIFNPSNRTIQFLYGPSGVGKTTIYKRLQEKIVERMLPILEMDRGRMPFAALEAVASDNGNFDWKDFYIRLLGEFREIAIEHKIDYDAIYNKDGLSDIRVQDPNRKLRKSVESTLVNRRPIALLIDEAQHMMKLSSGRRLRNQMDSIKSLASLSKTPIVLIGTYELLQFTNLSGQLARRSDDVHFQRYQFENEQHMEWFESVLYMFQRNMPLEEEPNLVGHTDFFYERCIGCIGTLKDWLTKSLEMALLKGKKTMEIDDFEKYALTLDQCIKMIREAREGELKLEDSDEKKNVLYSLLMANTSSEDEDEKEDDKPGKKDKKPKKNRKPGVRNPKRDSTVRETEKNSNAM